MYEYSREKDFIFTDEGQRMFLSIRDNVNRLLDKSGAVSMSKAIACQIGNSWSMMACVDRMVELEEIKEITNNGCPGQERVFVRVRKYNN